MKYEILEHKADLKIRVFGKTKEELFENAMVGVFGAHVVSFKNVKKIIKTWLGTDFFKKDKYIRRIEKLRQIEEGKLTI